MMKRTTKFKKGVASFYIVAFSTLILVVVATSFAEVVMSEMARTANNDLSQSAYDSALAGVEDAKIAFHNYQACVKSGATEVAPDKNAPLTCGEIIWYMNHSDCDMVAHILGRLGEDETEGEVLVQELNRNGNEMQQAYTCVKIKTNLYDYRSTLNSSNNLRVVKVDLSSGINARDIERVRISWYSDTDGSKYVFSNTNTDSTKVQFPVLRGGQSVATPPTISVSLVQAPSSFRLSDFDEVSPDGQGTNRGTVFFVPTNNAGMATKTVTDNYVGIYDATSKTNTLTKPQMVKSNDRTVKNLPYVVYCSDENEFACSVDMILPNVIGGTTRGNDTFMLALSLPYGQPSTDFSLEFFCASGNLCGTIQDASGAITHSEQAVLGENMQISIDSTGRANNLYRRVETRSDSVSYSTYMFGSTIELLGSSGQLLKKDLTVTKEWSDGTYPANLGSLLAK